MTAYIKMIDVWMIFTMIYPFSVVTLYSILQFIKEYDQNVTVAIKIEETDWKNKRLPRIVNFLLDFGLPFIVIIRNLSVKLMLFNFSVYRTLVCIDLVTHVFIILFLFACGDILRWHWQTQVMKMYRKVKREVERDLRQVETSRNRITRFADND